MNERIKELIEQATWKAMWPGDPDAGELNAEKLAELIIRECANVVFNKTGPKSALNVLEHFGVEE